MKKRRCTIAFFWVPVLLLLLAIPTVSAYGVGLGPSELLINNTLRGTSVERSLLVYNLGDAASTIELGADGSAAGWIRFYDGDTKGIPVTSVTLEAREKRPVIVRITIPADTANGDYNSTVHAMLKPTATTTFEVGVTAVMEARSTISISVTGEQSVSGTVEYIAIENTEVNFPLPIKVLFRNSGNVGANPEIKATISGKSGTLDTISSSETRVDAGQAELIIVRWTKTDIAPGNYTADVTVNLAGTQIASEKKPFTVEPAGTLSRQGNLTSLVYSGKPGTDTILKIIGTFQNSGAIETKAKMIGEVYRDGALVDTFTSDELSIPIYDKGDLTHYLNIQTPGSYTIKAYVLYEGKKTDLKELTFSTSAAAASKTSASGEKTPLLPGLAVLAIAGSIALVSRFGRLSR